MKYIKKIIEILDTELILLPGVTYDIHQIGGNKILEVYAVDIISYGDIKNRLNFSVNAVGIQIMTPMGEYAFTDSSDNTIKYFWASLLGVSILSDNRESPF